MTRALFFASALVAVASTASAQTTSTMTATILSVGSRATLSPATPLTVSINYAECVTNAAVVVRVNNIPTGTGVSDLDLWSGAGCNDQAMRTDTTSTVCNCLAVSAAPVGATQYDINTTAQALLGVGRTFKGSSVARTCDSVGLDGDSPWTVLVLGVATGPCSTDVTVSYATIGNGTATPFTVDTVAPLAPSSVTAGSGDTQVPVTWVASSTLGMGGSYAIFVDAAGAGADGGSGCDSGTLVGGGAAPASPYEQGIVATMGYVDASALGIAFGGSGAVAVAAEDRAYNFSTLSNVACFTRTQSFGFYSMYTADGGAAPKCSVEAPGSGVGAAGVGGMALGLIGLGLAKRLRAKRRG